MWKKQVYLNTSAPGTSHPQIYQVTLDQEPCEIFNSLILCYNLSIIFSFLKSSTYDQVTTKS